MTTTITQNVKLSDIPAGAISLAAALVPVTFAKIVGGLLCEGCSLAEIPGLMDRAEGAVARFINDTLVPIVASAQGFERAHFGAACVLVMTDPELKAPSTAAAAEIICSALSR